MNSISKLLLSALSRKRIALFMVTQIVGIIIIIVSLYLYVDVRHTLNNISGESDYVIITKRVDLLGTINSSRLGFSKRDIEALKEEAGVVDIGEFVSSNFRVLGGITMKSLGVSYRTDMFFEAVSDDFLDINPEGWMFDKASGIVPIIIPRNYLNLYNYGFAPTSGLPRLSEDMVKTALLDITISNRDGIEKHFKGKIVGFSSRINSILAPKSFVDWGNHAYAHKEGERAQRLIIKIEPSHSRSILQYLKTKGYEPENKIFDSEGVSRLVSFIVTATLIIGAVITLLSIALLLLTIYLIIERSRDKIFTLSTLGYGVRAILRPYMSTSIKSISLSFIIAYIAAVITRIIYADVLGKRLELTLGNGSHILPIITVVVLYVSIIFLIRKMIEREVKRAIQK